MQTELAKQVLSRITRYTDHEILLNKVRVSWLDNAELIDFLIYDAQGDTMAYAERLSVDYELFGILKSGYLEVEAVDASGLFLHLIKHDSSSKMNLSQFFQSLNSSDSVSNQEKKKTSVKLDQLFIEDLNLKISDRTKKKKEGKLDFSHLSFDFRTINVGKIQLESDTITGILAHLSGRETNSGFLIEEFKTNFSLSNKSLVFDQLDFRTSNSRIGNRLEFFYNGLDDFGYFVDSVSFSHRFSKTYISNKDIHLLSGKNGLKSDITLVGDFWGSVDDFNIANARIGFGAKSFLEGELSCSGLPDVKKTFIIADIVDSRLWPGDLEPYIGTISENLSRMGRIDFSGAFTGFLNDFVAKGEFNTDQGSVYSDINLKIPSDASKMSYEGNLELVNVNIGTFLKNEVVQSVNLVGNIKGQGILPDNADFNLEATLINSGVKDYVYDFISINGHFEKNFFKSTIDIIDPYCRLSGNAELDLRSNNQFLDVDIQVDRFMAEQLNLSTKKVFGSGEIDLSLRSFDIDRFVSDVEIKSATIGLEDRIVPLESLILEAGFDEDSVREFQLRMPGASSSLKGDFKLTDVIKDLPVLAKGYANKLQLGQLIQLDSLEELGSGETYKVNGSINLEDVQPYLDSLRLPMKVAENTAIELNFRQGNSSNLSIYLKSDSISINDNRFVDPVIEINGSSTISLSSILTNFIVKSSTQNFQGIPETEELLLEGIWYDNQIDIGTTLKQPSSSSDIQIESQMNLFQDSLVFKVLPSDIVILDDQWQFNSSNRIVIDTGSIVISNFEIYDQSESIRVSGIVSDHHETDISIAVEDLKMDKVNLFSTLRFDGFLNGSFDFFRNSAKELMRYEGGFLLKNLSYEDLLIGDLSGSSKWDPVEKSIYSDIQVSRDNFRSIRVYGYYYPERTNQLDFDVNFDQADLMVLRPLIKENILELNGLASGDLSVEGGISQPMIDGSFRVEKGSGKVVYLNTSYLFSGDINLNPDRISFSSFSIKDRKGANAALSGGIKHDYFKNFVTDLSLDIPEAENFEFLNTTALDNELYYGSAYGSGRVAIDGPINDLKINADVKTGTNTRLFIPVSETNNTAQEDYIQFINLSDTASISLEQSGSGIRGITLDFDIEVTSDAYCELIFDIKKGDIIRGRGRGNLKLSLNSNGEFTMFGPLEITQGAYNFTLYLINKEFEVEPGSRITWYGDPYNANLDLNAFYLQRASFEELKNPSERQEDNLSNKVPVLAILNIGGTMTAPEIAFDIQLQNESDADLNTTGDLSRIRSNEQELRRQFISLLLLKRFSPREGFFAGSGGIDVGGSVSEILSNQVSYLVSQIDENLEIEVDLASLDEESFNTFQVRFAYTFLDGRLKVTRGGGFGSDQDVNQNVLNNIVGDWSVEYSLTRDGRLRAKVFRNINERIINTTGDLSQETGISLRFIHSFNDLTELLTSRRNEAIRRREEDERQSQKGVSGSDLEAEGS